MESNLFRLLYKAGYVTEGNNKVVETGIKRIKHFMQDIGLALAVGCLLKSIGVSVVMEMVYLPLRCYSGGYQASSEKVCKYLSWGSIVGCLAVIRYVPIPVYLQHLLMLVSVVCIAVFAPVESPNKPLYEREKRVFRRISLVITAVAVFCYGGTVLFGADVYAKTICMAVVMVWGGLILD